MSLFFLNETMYKFSLQLPYGWNFFVNSCHIFFVSLFISCIYSDFCWFLFDLFIDENYAIVIMLAEFILSSTGSFHLWCSYTTQYVLEWHPAFVWTSRPWKSFVCSSHEVDFDIVVGIRAFNNVSDVPHVIICTCNILSWLISSIVRKLFTSQMELQVNIKIIKIW